MNEPRLYFARHGVTQANLDGVHAGAQPIPLLEEGREQARRLAERVCALGIDEVWTSPLARARETAGIVAARCGVPLREDPDLRELEVGPWEGLSDEQIRQRYPEEFGRWQADPAGFDGLPGRETLQAARRRVVAAVERIAARGVRALVVSHSEPIRLLRVHYAGDELNAFAEFMPEHAQLLELAPAEEGAELRPVAEARGKGAPGSSGG